MKNFIEEFKNFIKRGNVLDMAVGVVIGGAFSSIVTSLVNDVIMPIIGIIIGGLDFTGIAITVGNANILVGNFIQNVVNFLIVAFVIFSVIKAINKLDEIRKTKEAKAEEDATPEDPADIKLLKSIEQELKKLNKK